jgi:hypothetical protein
MGDERGPCARAGDVVLGFLEACFRFFFGLFLWNGGVFSKVFVLFFWRG